MVALLLQDYHPYSHCKAIFTSCSPYPMNLLVCSILWGLCTQHLIRQMLGDLLHNSVLPSYSGKAVMLSAIQTSWM